MRNLSKCLVALGLAVGLFSCSSDDPGNVGNGGTAPKDGVYSSIKFTFPKTRSTAKEGEEVGKDFENNIGSILVVLAQKADENSNYTFVSYALNDAPISSSTANTYTVTFQDKEALALKAGQKVFVFAYCNPSESLRTKIAGTLGADGTYTGGLTEGDTFTDEIFQDEDVYNTWKDNGFLMTNVEIVENTLPTADALKNEYNSPDHAWNLGTVPVMRTMSRFDFRDASANGDYTYEIKDPNDDTKVQGKVKLTRVALFNLADKFYYLPRIGTAADAFTLCPGFDGMEVTGDNFVISPAGRNYLEPLPTTDFDPANLPAELKWATMDQIAGKDINNIDGWGDGLGQELKEGYHIWRYATENTFLKDGNTPANTTGYVFEAEILPNAEFGNVKDGAYQTMYLYNGILYPNAMAMYTESLKTPISTLTTAINNAFELAKDAHGDVTAVTPKSDELVKAMGFTAYKPIAYKNNPDDESEETKYKYVCYYFAFNTHNQGTLASEIEPMEFATVRNNVYKLAVTSIKRFGTYTPPTDVDEWDTYFTLSVVVRPWVVRINNLDF